MPLHYSADQIHDHAVQLGLIGSADAVPQNMRSRIVASLAAQGRQAPDPDTAADAGTRIEVRPGVGVLVDGATLPWVAPDDPVDVHLDPAGGGTVRLTLRAGTILIHPATTKDNRT